MLGVSSPQIGPAVLQQVHAQRAHAAVAVGRERRRLELIAPCDRRDHVLAAGLDPLHGPAGEPRGLRERELLGVDVDLRAEAAADVRRDHAHLRLGDAADRRHERPHEVRHLGRGVERELAARGDPVGDHAARLQRDRREALVVDRQRDLDGRCVERLVEALGLVLDREAVIAGRLLVQLRRAGLARVLGVDHDGQRARSRRRRGRPRRARSPGSRRRPVRPARRPCAPCPRPGSGAWAGRRCRTGWTRRGRRPRARGWRS